MGFAAGYEKLLTAFTRGAVVPATLGDVFKPNTEMPDMSIVIGSKLERTASMQLGHELGQRTIQLTSRVIEPNPSQCAGVVDLAYFASDPRNSKPEMVVRHALDWDDDGPQQVRAVVGISLAQLVSYDREYDAYADQKLRWNRSAMTRKRKPAPVAPADLMYSLRTETATGSQPDMLTVMSEVGAAVPAVAHLAHAEMGGTTFRVQTPPQFEAMADWLLEKAI